MNKSFLYLALFILCLPLNVVAEDMTWNPLMTAAPGLSITPDARAGGMGDLGAATSPDINSQYWNPSKYAFMESEGGLSVAYTPWLRKIVGDIDLAYLSGYYKLDDVQALSASFRYFSLGQIPMTDAMGTPLATAQPYELAADLAYSRKLSQKFSMAVAFRFLYSDLNNGVGQGGAGTTTIMYPGWSLAADIAGYYVTPIDLSLGESKLSVGFNLSNLGSKISYDNGYSSQFIPTNLRLGVAYEIPIDQFNTITFSAEANKFLVPTVRSKFAKGDDSSGDPYKMTSEEYSEIGVMKGLFWSFADAPGGIAEEMQEVNWALGMEYAYNKQFFVRAGYYNEHEDKGNRKFFTVGAGFKLSMFQLDAGYVISVAQSNPLDQTLRFSLSFDMYGLKELVQ